MYSSDSLSVSIRQVNIDPIVQSNTKAITRGDQLYSADQCALMEQALLGNVRLYKNIKLPLSE